MMRILCCASSIVSVSGIGVGKCFDDVAGADIECLKPRFLSTAVDVPLREIPFSNEEIFKMLADNYSVVLPSRVYTRTALLSMLTVADLLKSSPDVSGKRVVVVNATTAGGMDKSEVYYHNLTVDGSADLALVAGHEPADATNLVCGFLQSRGAEVVWSTTVSTACSSSSVAIGIGMDMLRSGDADYAICMGVDPLCKFTVNGFNSLGILSKNVCRPFDAERDGLNLGEGAASVMLAGDEFISSVSDNIPTLCEVLSCETAADAYHQTATSPDAVGPTLAMKAALRKAGVDAGQISYVNAHGTATPNNDESESTAMINIFGENVPPFSSTKFWTGHTLGASGVLEFALSAEMLCRQTLLPTRNFKNEERLTPVTTAVKTPLEYIMTNSFGFGGGATSIIIKKV
ncbi:MAG: beta-ketoacyl-[acyl-carrier-protein] synthase family protein [Paludibacteraceae bacterium]|nr:beta-ketoacyl-[acyl-carrier-protein] synthase family protein [Paludibacteraceae bacterium]